MGRFADPPAQTGRGVRGNGGGGQPAGGVLAGVCAGSEPDRMAVAAPETGRDEEPGVYGSGGVARGNPPGAGSRSSQDSVATNLLRRSRISFVIVYFSMRCSVDSDSGPIAATNHAEYYPSA